jgi:hypothetical protein
MKNGCMICNEELGYEPQMCCSGFMCGCGGRPIDPSICSNECFDILEHTDQDTCMCGDSMKRHQNPFDAGHSPVSTRDYAVSSMMERRNVEQ